MHDSLRRDNTDGDVIKTENKTLKKQVGPLKDKIRDLEDENNRLRSELDALRERFDAECEECENEKALLRARADGFNEDLQSVLEDLNQMRSENMSLNLEISCYRKLLEGEERKMASSIEMSQNIQSSGGAALASIIGGGGGGGGGGFSQSSQSSMSESSGTVRMQKQSKGPVGIKEVNQGGSFIVLNNTKTKDVNLESWVLERKYGRSGEKVAKYTFPKNTILRGGKEIRIFSYNFADEAESDDLVADRTCKTFGTGNGSITLIDFPGEDQKAQCTISYQQ